MSADEHIVEARRWLKYASAQNALEQAKQIWSVIQEDIRQHIEGLI